MKLQLGRIVIGAVLSGSASMVVKEAIVNNIPEATNTVKKVIVGIGAASLGYLASKAVSEEVDVAFNQWDELMKTIKEEKE